LPANNADELFTELEASLVALERLAEPPLTTAIALARLKRYLPDHLRHIDLHDLVMQRLDPIRDAVEAAGAAPRASNEEYAGLLDRYLEASRPLLALLVVGVYHDVGVEHARLWGAVFDRLLALRRPPDGAFNAFVWKAQHYPALLAFYAMGAASILNYRASSRSQLEKPIRR
jgi:hypothetical protein